LAIIAQAMRAIITLTFVRGLRVRVEAPPVLDVNLPKEGAAAFHCSQTSSV